MRAQDSIRTLLSSTKDLLGKYLADLSDADLLVRPVPAANHIAWQLGHLIASEHGMAEASPVFVYPALAKTFNQQHSKETAKLDPPKGFGTKEQYLSLFNAARQATIAGLEKMSDKDLDQPTKGQMAEWAPTLGALLVLVGNHTMMHVGQFTVVRRKLGKPVLF